MAVGDVHVGDIGTVFRAEIKDGDSAVDVRSAATKEIHFKKPDNSTLQKTAEYYDDGSDGKIQYTSVSGDFVAADVGIWKWQAYVVTLGGGYWHSEIKTFELKANLI
jgi:hypothetical protein